VLASSALVLLMTAPGLALFYGGLVRRKNVLATLMQSFIMAAMVSVQWVLFGYSLAFSPGHMGLVGGLDWIGLNNVSATTPYAGYAATIPRQTYMTVLGAASHAVAGLVAITPASGFVGPISSIIIGGLAGALCHGAVRMKGSFGYDDALDVVGVHGVGGIWGALATGLFASVAVNSAGANGLFFGNPKQLLTQLTAVVASVTFAFVGSIVLLKFTDALVGLRVDEDGEPMGLDLSEHDESGYALEA